MARTIIIAAYNTALDITNQNGQPTEFFTNADNDTVDDEMELIKATGYATSGTMPYVAAENEDVTTSGLQVLKKGVLINSYKIDSKYQEALLVANSIQGAIVNPALGQVVT